MNEISFQWDEKLPRQKTQEEISANPHETVAHYRDQYGNITELKRSYDVNGKSAAMILRIEVPTKFAVRALVTEISSPDQFITRIERG